MFSKAADLPSYKAHEIANPFGYVAEIASATAQEQARLAQEAAAAAEAAAKAKAAAEGGSVGGGGGGRPGSKKAAGGKRGTLIGGNGCGSASGSVGAAAPSGDASVAAASVSSSSSTLATTNDDDEEEKEEEDEAIGLTFLEHVAMQRELRRPLAVCRDADEYKAAMQHAHVLCDTSSRPLEDGFVAYYGASTHGELLLDARALGVGSFDDLVQGAVTVTGKGDGGTMVKLVRHWLSPHHSIGREWKRRVSWVADIQDW